MYKASVTIPSVSKNGEHFSYSQRKPIIDNVCYNFSRVFGGCTVQHAQGFWYSDEQDKIVSEQVDIVWAYVDQEKYMREYKGEGEPWHFVEDNARYVRIVLDQECVLWTYEEISGRVAFV